MTTDQAEQLMSMLNDLYPQGIPQRVLDNVDQHTLAARRLANVVQAAECEGYRVAEVEPDGAGGVTMRLHSDAEVSNV